ncbi:MAG TPA: NAD(P)H-binding protein [Byssovorax sp.]
MAPRSCLLVGASGLVGGHLLALLLADADCASVNSLGRRALGVEAPKLTEVVTDFEDPAALAAHARVDEVYCALGTTIKKAGSEAAFRKVDFDYPLAVARAAVAAGAHRYSIVTAVGADAKSSIFYNRVKGELEDALRELPFPGGVFAFRPSMLLGDRSESRPAERVGKAVMSATRGLFAFGLKRYRAIDATDVARAMWAARAEPDGSRVYEGAPLFALARR